MKIRRIKAIIIKEFIHVIRDTRSLVIALVVPAFLLLVFGYALKLDVDNVAIAIIDYDNSPYSREFSAKFESSEYFNVLYYLDDYKIGENLINKSKVKALIVIPTDYSRNLVNGDEAKIQAILDASDTNVAASISNYITSVVNNTQIEFVKNNSLAQVIPQVTPEVRFWFNEDLVSAHFLVPGIVAIVMAVVAGLLTSLTIAREWETGTMEQLIPTPIKPAEILLGKLITYLCIGFFDIAICVLMGEFVFHVPMKGSVILIFLFSTLFLFSMLTFGILVSVIAKTQSAASQITSILTILPAFILSNFIFEVSSMPIPIQAVTYIFPARYFVDLLRTTYLKGNVFETIIINVAFMVIYTIILVVISLRMFKLEKE